MPRVSPICLGPTLRLWRNAGKARNAGTERPFRVARCTGSLHQEEAPMNRTLLTIALVAAAGTAGAQTVTTPAGSVNAGAGSAASGAATMTAPPAGAGA